VKDVLRHRGKGCHKYACDLIKGLFADTCFSSQHKDLMSLHVNFENRFMLNLYELLFSRICND